MSATRDNAGLEMIGQATAFTPHSAPPVSTPWPTTEPSSSGREALQALLAFSALHEQIRQRRAIETHNDRRTGAEDALQLEHFVLDEVLQLVAERAVGITGADGVGIALADGDAIVCRASVGKAAPDPGARLDPNAGFSGACLALGQIVRCDDSEIDTRVDALACRRLGARSMVAVPLTAKQTVIGLVEAFSAEPYGFNDSDIRSLNLLAELILCAIRPEEEDRLAEISRRVVGQKAKQSLASEISVRENEPYWPALEAGQGKTNGPARSSGREALKTSTPGLMVVVLLLLFAFALGGGLWWSIHRHTPSGKAKPQSVSPTPAQTTGAAAAGNLPEDETSPEPSTSQIAALPAVTGIRHWSSADSSTVVVDLQDQVQYEAHRLTNPERIYFDLHDTKLGPGLPNVIDVGDELLQKIRIAQPVSGVTRVVLFTKGGSNFSVSLEPNPFRLVVEVRATGAQPEAREKADLFARPAEEHATTSPEIRSLASRPRIVLDAGHGGWDRGTVGRKGLLEKDLVLDIVSRLGSLIEHRLRAEVIYTRTDDNYVALEKRAEIANLSRADLFMSIHANYSDYSSARGVETYYTNTYSSVRARTRDNEEPAQELQNAAWTNVDIREKVHESHRLAAMVQRALYGVLANKNPGLRNRGVKQAEYVVLTGTSMPAILAEVSFVSSPTDEDNLQSTTYRQQIAEALYQGLSRYVEESSRMKMASVSTKLTAR